MYIDFIDQNKAYPKHSLPLSRIDLNIDSTAGHKMLSFMDAYSKYNQIHMSRDVEEKITFITGGAHYYYRVMPFHLKNFKATYQRQVNQMFKQQIGRNVEVYVDNLLVKARIWRDMSGT